MVKFFLRDSLLNKFIGSFIKFQSQVLNFSDSVVYLGIVLDHNLSFSSQFKLSKKNLFFYLKIFYFLKNFISSKTFTMIYKSFILPKFEYVNIFYQHTNKNQLTKLEKINKKILKLTNCDISFYSIENRLFYLASLFLFKQYSYKYNDFLFSKFITSNVSSSNRLFILPITSKEKFKKSFCYWGANLMNFWFQYSHGEFLVASESTFTSNLKVCRKSLLNFL